jgi:hypothetical protein
VYCKSLNYGETEFSVILRGGLAAIKEFVGRRPFLYS